LDPTEGVSNQVKRLYDKLSDKCDVTADQFFTSGDSTPISEFIKRWLKMNVEVQSVVLDE